MRLFGIQKLSTFRKQKCTASTGIAVGTSTAVRYSKGPGVIGGSISITERWHFVSPSCEILQMAFLFPSLFLSENHEDDPCYGVTMSNKITSVDGAPPPPPPYILN